LIRVNVILAKLKRHLALPLLTFSIVAGLLFLYALQASLRSTPTGNVSCSVGSQAGNRSLQLTVEEQDPKEPVFRGKYLLTLGDSSGKEPLTVIVRRSPTGSYAGDLDRVDLRYGQIAGMGTLLSDWQDIGLVSVSGSHRDFPFDSAKFDFEMSFEPTVSIENVRISNALQSFDLDCDSLNVQERSGSGLEIKFEERRNRVVQLTAVLLVVAAFLFLLGIVLFAKSESLPTSIASFFFSLWSIRSILSSEIKTFPTILDLAILFLCVFLLVLIGVRISLKELRPKRKTGHSRE
jgi:hypothetical protein